MQTQLDFARGLLEQAASFLDTHPELARDNVRRVLAILDTPPGNDQAGGWLASIGDASGVPQRTVFVPAARTPAPNKGAVHAAKKALSVGDRRTTPLNGGMVHRLTNFDLFIRFTWTDHFEEEQP